MLGFSFRFRSPTYSCRSPGAPPLVGARRAGLRRTPLSGGRTPPATPPCGEACGDRAGPGIRLGGRSDVLRTGFEGGRTRQGGAGWAGPGPRKFAPGKARIQAFGLYDRNGAAIARTPGATEPARPLPARSSPGRRELSEPEADGLEPTAPAPGPPAAELHFPPANPFLALPLRSWSQKRQTVRRAVLSSRPDFHR